MTSRPARSVGIALAVGSVVLAGAAPFLYVATLDVPFLRRSGLVLFALLVLALAGVARARAFEAPLSRVAVVLVFTLTLAVTWFFFVRQRLPADRAPAIGMPAPAVAAIAPDGSAFDFEAARGAGPILLVFYRGFWSLTCLSELRGLGVVHERLRARGGRVVAIAVDPPDRTREVVATEHLVFPVLSDADLTTTRAYGLVDESHVAVDHDLAIPAQLLIDREGVLRWRHVSTYVQDRLGPEATWAAVAAVLPPP